MEEDVKLFVAGLARIVSNFLPPGMIVVLAVVSVFFTLAVRRRWL